MRIMTKTTYNAGMKQKCETMEVYVPEKAV